MSKPPRFFIIPDQVQGPRITLTGEDLRHIRTVLRKKPGDLLTLLDGRGAEYAVRITDIRIDRIDTEVLDWKQRDRPGPVMTLGQGIAKADKMDWIVQKATELGVSSIAPLITGRTIVRVKDGEKRLGRWQKICREAAMQCGRPDIPRIQDIRTYLDFLRGIPQIMTPHHPPLARGDKEEGGAALLLIPWEEGGEPLKQVLRAHPASQHIVVLIGPEGGFALSEVEAAKEKGFHLVSLGPTILRTETAAVAVLSMIGYEYLR